MQVREDREGPEPSRGGGGGSFEPDRSTDVFLCFFSLVPATAVYGFVSFCLLLLLLLLVLLNLSLI